jgi:hypothetical protein
MQAKRIETAAIEAIAGNVIRRRVFKSAGIGVG